MSVRLYKSARDYVSKFDSKFTSGIICMHVCTKGS